MEPASKHSPDNAIRDAGPDPECSTTTDKFRKIQLEDLKRELGSYREKSSSDAAHDESDDERKSTKGPEQDSECDIWNTPPQTGLTSAEAAIRLKEYGYNRMSEEELNWWRHFFSFFRGPIQYVMFAAAALAGGLRDWVDFAVILVLLVLNAAVGFTQEYQAGSVVQELKKSLALESVVLRDGQEQSVEAINVVPGDILCLAPGSIVAADARIIDNTDYFLLVDQSSITGESFAAEKRSGDELFASSLVKSGFARAVVWNTGNETCVAQTAALVNRAAGGTGHFTEVLTQIGTILLALVVLTLIIVWIAGFFKAATTVALLRYTLAITIVGVPVGLPAVITTTIAVGAAYLARKKAIVRKLAAIESLAGVEILCSDKTGTLTQNQLSLKRPVPCEGHSLDSDLMLTACLTLNQPLDPIDRAFSLELLSSKNYPVTRSKLSNYHITKFQPFDPVSKRVIAHVEDENGQQQICAKGAPFSILRMVTEEMASLNASKKTLAGDDDNEDGDNDNDNDNDNDEESITGTDSGSTCINSEILNKYNSDVEKYALRGYRTIGVARKLSGGPWELLGVVPCYDPPRKDTAWTINEAKSLGLKIKMLTGDDVGIAKETSRQLGLGTRIFKADVLLSGPNEENDKTNNKEMSAYGSKIESPQGTMYATSRNLVRSLASSISFSDESLQISDKATATAPRAAAAASAACMLQMAAFTELIEEADGFAEVFPEHKHNVVEILQSKGYLVAMTGDGVNDAPSLKKADTGIAVEGSTNAAQVAADIVFLAPGLSAIIDALKTSRQIFHRMYAYIVYRIALSVHLELFLGLWMIILNRSLNIELVVFIAIFADIATLAIAYDDAPVLKRPAKWNLPKIWFTSLVLGSILAIGTWLTLGTTLLGHSGVIEGRGNLDAVLFLQITLSENWLIFITRANGPFWSNMPSWQLLGAVVLVDIIATAFCVCGWFVNEPTSALSIVRIWLLSLGIFVVCGAIHYIIEDSGFLETKER